MGRSARHPENHITGLLVKTLLVRRLLLKLYLHFKSAVHTIDSGIFLLGRVCSLSMGAGRRGGDQMARRSQVTEFKSQLHHLLALQPWAR